MTMEADLTTLLKTLCPRVHPDVAPTTTTLPYVTYQAIGGRSLRWLDRSASDKRHTLLQINVWAGTRAAANALMRQIEDAMCASTDFTAWPNAEPISAHEDAPDVYGCIQDYTIYSER